MKIHLVSLGCARNLIDSEIMLGRLLRTGAKIVDDPGEAEVIIVNTCSFIDSAADESIDTILALAKYKKNNSCRRLVVTGCLPERYREDIVDAIPEVDVFLGTGAFDRIVEAVDGYLDTAGCILPDPDSVVPSGVDATRARGAPHMAYLKIAEGCSKHCTYCIIPKLRGKQKSRPLEDIVSEACDLVRVGVKELVLVSQDTTAYGKDLPAGPGLGQLLDALANIPAARESTICRVPAAEKFWIRFLYGHPESIDESVLRTVAQHANICSYFDIPIQHASDPVLKRMGRNYTKADLYRLVDRMRSLVPEAALRTTVIVGFPGETDQEFNELMQFAGDVRFNHLGCFMYSDAEDLPSHRLADHVPQTVARERYDMLMSTQVNISSEHNRRYVGRSIPVLIEEQLEAHLFAGRSAFQAPEVDGVTYVRSQQLQIGCISDIRITDALEYDLAGEAE
jgi:ribosomal protein S12 methylthiotransferase